MRFHHLSGAIVAGGLLLIGTTGIAGQQPPPIDGVTGTVAFEGTVQKTDEAGQTVVVKTLDGVEHLVHLTKRTVVHGGRAAGEGLSGLEEGSTVVVHYTSEGADKTAHEVDRIAADGLQVTEGTVTKVDRGARTITIQLADGSRQTLRLTERAASDSGRDIDEAAAGSAKVVVYYTDREGHRVAHHFKRIS
jgi:hypothetical protein